MTSAGLGLQKLVSRVVYCTATRCGSRLDKPILAEESNFRKMQCVHVTLTVWCSVIWCRKGNQRTPALTIHKLKYYWTKQCKCLLCFISEYRSSPVQAERRCHAADSSRPKPRNIRVLDFGLWLTYSNTVVRPYWISTYLRTVRTYIACHFSKLYVRTGCTDSILNYER